MRRGLITGGLTLALVLTWAGVAGARGWSLYLRPGKVAQGGTIRIWTTARRACPLTIRIAGHNYRYRLDRGGDRFSLDRGTPVGKDRVTVHCRGLVASETFRVVKRAGNHPAPTAPAGSPPASSPPAAPVPKTTPVTVYNVCHLDPGLGTQHVLYPVINGQVWPTVAWLDSSGQLAFLAASTNGDGPVDIAVIPTAANRSVAAYFARCSWPNWVSVDQWQQAQQPGITAAQAGSLAYLQEVMPINDSLDSLALPWVTPQVGWSTCPTDPYSECDFEPVGPDGEPLSDVG